MYICIDRDEKFFAAYDDVKVGIADILLLHPEHKIVNIYRDGDRWMVELIHPIQRKEEFTFRPVKVYHAEDVKRP